MRNAYSAELAREVDDQSAPIVVEQPVFEVMQARKIFAGAFTAAVAVELLTASTRALCPADELLPG